MRRSWRVFLVAAVLAAGFAGLATHSPADSPAKPDFTPEEEQVHNDLRALQQRLLKAYEDRKLEGMLENLHPDVVVTWQNGQVSRGHQGVRDFYKEMMEGPSSAVIDLKSKCTVDDWAVLYNDLGSAVAFGKLEDDFTLRNGMKFHLESRWTADVVKQNDQWLIVAFHVSTNMFDNGVMSLVMTQVRNWTAAIAGGVGMALGAAVGFLLARGRKTA